MRFEATRGLWGSTSCGRGSGRMSQLVACVDQSPEVVAGNGSGVEAVRGLRGQGPGAVARGRSQLGVEAAQELRGSKSSLWFIDRG